MTFMTYQSMNIPFINPFRAFAGNMIVSVTFSIIGCFVALRVELGPKTLFVIMSPSSKFSMTKSVMLNKYRLLKTVGLLNCCKMTAFMKDDTRICVHGIVYRVSFFFSPHHNQTLVICCREKYLVRLQY